MIINCIKNNITVDDIKEDNTFILRDTESSSVFLIRCNEYMRNSYNRSKDTFYLNLAQNTSSYVQGITTGNIILTKGKLKELINSKNYRIRRV